MLKQHSLTLDPPSCGRGRTLAREGWTESFLTFGSEVDGQDLKLALDGSRALSVDVFGTSSQIAAMDSAVAEAGLEAPVLRVISRSPSFSGMQIHAITGLEAEPVLLGGRLVGYCFEDASARFCVLSGLLPDDMCAEPTTQAESVFRIISGALEGVGMTFADVARTWFYNDDILDWYDGFNCVRTSFFHSHNISRMPASTGIGAPNPFGAALIAKALAVGPKSPKASIHAIVSSRQCEASSYGSSFSRAVEVRNGASRYLYISGTASIAPGGQTAHVGDPALQIATTIKAVTILLDAAEMSFADTVRAVAYFRNPADRCLWESYCAAIPEQPLVLLDCVVCRDDLLFEIELDAAR